MNVRLLRKIQKHILEEPNRFAMGLWIDNGEPGAPLGPLPNKYMLTHANAWPLAFKKRYRTAKTPAARAKIACERIEHFIKTGGEE